MQYKKTAIYTLSIGFNDKDEKRQILSDEKIVALIKGTLDAFIDGYTLRLNVCGVWCGEAEKSCDAIIIDCDDEKIGAICSALCEVLNQQSIAIQKNYSNVLFFER